MSLQTSRYFFTVAEFERMGEAGIFAKDARRELIEGALYDMPVIGSRHAACVDLLARLLRVQVEDFAIVRVQNPIQLDDYSEPQPDVALLRLRADFYRHAHPTPADVLLIIEVADTTVDYDRLVKGRSMRRPESKRSGSSTCSQSRSKFTPNRLATHIKSRSRSNAAKRLRHTPFPI